MRVSCVRYLCVGLVVAAQAAIAVAQEEPAAILVKSSSPVVAARVEQALRTAGVSPAAYRIKTPSGGGSLPLAEVVQLERRVTATNKKFGQGASDIIILVKVITKGSEMEKLVRDALKDVDQGLYQLEVVPGATGPDAVLVKSSSPLVAERTAAALRRAGVDPRAYRIKAPAGGGSLPLQEVAQLERRVTATNKKFGQGASDIIILVKVITKGSEMEQLVRSALKDVDQSLYQLEVVQGAKGPDAVLVKSSSPLVAEKAATALRSAGVDQRAYRINMPTGGGSLPLAEVVQLERRVTATNKRFGQGASDIIILVKVITKGSEMEKLVRDALKDVDQSLYQLEVVRQ
jgi:galactitol-specific phosphotransferase system IIB component